MTTERRTRIAIAVVCVLMFGSWIAYAFEQYDRRQRQEALKARIEALEVQFANEKKLIDQRKK
jgi:hypothetical protein